MSKLLFSYHTRTAGLQNMTYDHQHNMKTSMANLENRTETEATGRKHFRQVVGSHNIINVKQ